MAVIVAVGTDKGLFLLRAGDARRDWRVEGPLFKGWKVTAFSRDGAGGWLAGTASFVYGAAIQHSRDLKDWKQVEHGPAYPPDGKHKLTQIWRLVSSDGACYAGVAEAGLFRSEDHGETWRPVRGLNEHRTRDAWQPGAGGLCAHSILIDPQNARRMWCGISAVGVFRSDDGGESWQARNDGVPVILEDKDHQDIGFCVHALAPDPHDADVIFRQDHRGMFRSRDGGDRWERIENGLPSGFGFPLCIDRNTKALYAVPLESDEYRMPRDGALRVCRSTDGGDSWHALSAGLPQEHAYAGVLRTSMAVDNLQPGGVYFGTTGGEVFTSSDGGDSWTALPSRFPRIHCVEAFAD